MFDLSRLQGSSVFDGAALDEAVDHFGPQTIFLLLSPHADVQKEFFDRARINTIKKYQVGGVVSGVIASSAVFFVYPL